MCVGMGLPSSPWAPIQPASLLSLGPARSALAFTSARLREAVCWGCDGGHWCGCLRAVSTTGLSPLPSAAHHLVWDLEPPTKTLQTHVYQQTEKTESRGVLAEGATDVVERSWATDQGSRRADGLLLGGRRQGWGEEACQHRGIVGAKE